jgi:phage terminase large subunit-like protein
MKFERLNVSKVEIKNKKMLYRSRKTPENMPLATQLVALVGSRGVGKTTRICEWLMMYDNTKSYDKVWVISPTFPRDEKTKVLTEEPRNFKIEIVPKYTEDGFQGICNGWTS